MDKHPGLRIVGVDSNPRMRRECVKRGEREGIPMDRVELHDAYTEDLPFEDGAFDIVFASLVFCSVIDARIGVQEAKRVLQPGGQFVFLEHVREKNDIKVQQLQRLLEPMQRAMTDGCRLTQDTGGIIQAAGFADVDIQERKNPMIGQGGFVDVMASCVPLIVGRAHKAA